jgi:hypothetical protein
MRRTRSRIPTVYCADDCPEGQIFERPGENCQQIGNTSCLALTNSRTGMGDLFHRVHASCDTGQDPKLPPTPQIQSGLAA